MDGVRDGTIDPQGIIKTYLEKVTHDDRYNAFVRVHADYVERSIDDALSKPLAGAPIAIKDIVLTKWYETTCCSAMLQGYVPPYSATVFEKLQVAGGLMIGKTNMDEFAMGASNETSFFWPVKNPFDETRVTGGSSGWNAAAVAADLCLGAVGTDTGGSIRQPAALCWVVWAKATYGRTSRYGVQAMASSLDHIGVLTKTVEDAVILMSHMSGKDDHDVTTIPFTAEEQESRQRALKRDNLRGKHIAVPQQFFGEGLDEGVKQCCLETIEYLRSQWAEVEWIDMPILEYSVPTYYIICPAEVSTNMARFDGVRFGLQEQTEWFDRIYDYYAHIRDKGFGSEVKRRILTGAYVLSAGFYDAYYRKATAVRKQMIREFDTLFQQFDAVVWPTSPEVAWKIGEKVDDPVKMYLADIYTIPANLVGNPALSVPCGFVEKEGKQLPVGFQIMTKHRDEATMWGIGKMVEMVHW